MRVLSVQNDIVVAVCSSLARASLLVSDMYLHSLHRNNVKITAVIQYTVLYVQIFWCKMYPHGS